MAEVLLALGGNQGAYSLAYALTELKRLGELQAMSSLVKGPALPVPGWEGNVADFLNFTLVMSTVQSLPELTEVIHALEQTQSRRRDLPGVCTLDIDVLRYEGVWQRPFELHRPHIRLALHELLGMPEDEVAWPLVQVCHATELDAWLQNILSSA
ncbi:MAG: hypothetical protein HKM02_02195 [Pseudomonadales bacterium]|nr:hypothetical protein [Pseudomonadales bacterium]